MRMLPGGQVDGAHREVERLIRLMRARSARSQAQLGIGPH